MQTRRQFATLMMGTAAVAPFARAGAKVRLFEAQGSLGGVWTSGLLGCMIDFGKSSIDREITRRLKDLGAWRSRRRDGRGGRPSRSRVPTQSLNSVSDRG